MRVAQDIKHAYNMPGRNLDFYHRVTISVKDANSLVYLDRKLISEKKLKKQVFDGNGIWMLGQEQDAFGGGFSQEQRVIGSICNFRMWNSGLNKTGVTEFFKNPKLITVQPVFDNPPTYRFEKNNGAH